MDEPIISVSGLRGIVGESLTPEIAVRYASALAGELPPGPLVITRDGRASGPMLAAALCKGLTALGRDIFAAGVAATPTLGVLVRQHRAAGGVEITASHNPPQYNGLKLFGADGAVLSASVGTEIQALFLKDKTRWANWARIAETISLSSMTTSCESAGAQFDRH